MILDLTHRRKKSRIMSREQKRTRAWEVTVKTPRSNICQSSEVKKKLFCQTLTHAEQCTRLGFEGRLTRTKRYLIPPTLKAVDPEALLVRRKQVCRKWKEASRGKAAKRSAVPDKGQGGACSHTYVLPLIVLQRRQGCPPKKRHSCKQESINLTLRWRVRRMTAAVVDRYRES